MTDFFDELERELRRAHRRDTASHARSRGFARRWLPGLPAPGPRTLVALAAVAAVAWLVAIVLVVGRNWDADRQSAAPQPSPTPAPGVLGCLPSDWWEAPIVDEPIPQEIASRLAVFRDHPRPTGDMRLDGQTPRQAKKLYRGALTLRPRLVTGAQLRVVMIAADITTAAGDHDFCAPPPDPTVPGICLTAYAPNDALEGECFTIDQIENADGWISVHRRTPDPLGPQRRTVVGLAPDGVDRVTFDTATGTKSLSVNSNVFAGEIRSTDRPFQTDARFAP